METNHKSEIFIIEEYNNELCEAAKPVAELMDSLDFLGEENKDLFGNFRDFSIWLAQTGIPFMMVCTKILLYRKSFDFFTTINKESEILKKWPKLTYEEFYDKLISLPNYVIRILIGELDCITSTFENLQFHIINRQKEKAIEEMRKNNIDITYVSRLTSMYTDDIINCKYQLTIIKDKLYKSESVNQIQQQMRLAKIYEMENKQNDFLKCERLYSDLLISLETDNLNESRLQEVLELCKNNICNIVYPMIYDYWDNLGDYTFYERKVLDGILRRDLAAYNDLINKYELNRKEALKLPMGIYKQELDEIYLKIGNYCPPGQDFASIFGYSEEFSQIIWSGDWNTLSYFLKVLYTGILVGGKIKFNLQMPRKVWDNAVKLFINKNKEHPKLKTLKYRNTGKLERKAFAKDINAIFIDIFEKIDSRKA